MHCAHPSCQKCLWTASMMATTVDRAGHVPRNLVRTRLAALENQQTMVIVQAPEVAVIAQASAATFSSTQEDSLAAPDCQPKNFQERRAVCLGTPSLLASRMAGPFHQ